QALFLIQEHQFAVPVKRDPLFRANDQVSAVLPQEGDGIAVEGGPWDLLQDPEAGRVIDDEDISKFVRDGQVIAQGGDVLQLLFIPGTIVHIGYETAILPRIES